MFEEEKIKTFKNKFKFITGNESAEEKIVYIPIKAIMPNPYQPRRCFEITSLNELAQSIKEVGVITPITVRVAPGGYELVCGERRVRASRIAGKEKIPAIIVTLSDKESAILAITENLQRRDLSFFEEAESMQNLIECHNLTQEQIAKKLGKSQAAVANKIRLLKLPEKIRSLINEGNLCERHARALLRLQDEELQLAATKRIIELNLNVSAAERMIQRMIEDIPKREFLKKDNSSFEKTSRLFKNTVRKTYEMLKKSGISATINEKEEENYIEYTIKLEK